MRRTMLAGLVVLVCTACTPAQMLLWDDLHDLEPGTTAAVTEEIRSQQVAGVINSTQTTTTTTTTTTAPPAPTYSVDGAIQAAFGDLGPGVVSQARRVAQCESRMNPRALNGNPRYQAAGLFQIIKQWASSYQRVTGVPYYDGRFDAYANARFARYLYDDAGGWRHWVCKP